MARWGKWLKTTLAGLLTATALNVSSPNVDFSNAPEPRKPLEEIKDEKIAEKKAQVEHFYKKELEKEVTELAIPTLGYVSSNWSLWRCLKGKPCRPHRGKDFAAITSENPPVMASATGIVTEAGRAGGKGNHVTIAHNSGFETKYFHLKKMPIVNVGDTVLEGQMIGIMGASGHTHSSKGRRATHLHQELWIDGKNVNPNTYYKGFTKLRKGTRVSPDLSSPSVQYAEMQEDFEEFLARMDTTQSYGGMDQYLAEEMDETLEMMASLQKEKGSNWVSETYPEFANSEAIEAKDRPTLYAEAINIEESGELLASRLDGDFGGEIFDLPTGTQTEYLAFSDFTPGGIKYDKPSLETVVAETQLAVNEPVESLDKGTASVEENTEYLADNSSDLRFNFDAYKNPADYSFSRLDAIEPKESNLVASVSEFKPYEDPIVKASARRPVSPKTPEPESRPNVEDKFAASVTEGWVPGIGYMGEEPIDPYSNNLEANVTASEISYAQPEDNLEKETLYGVQFAANPRPLGASELGEMFGSEDYEMAIKEVNGQRMFTYYMPFDSLEAAQSAWTPGETALLYIEKDGENLKRVKESVWHINS